jgi:hypothetical protein
VRISTAHCQSLLGYCNTYVFHPNGVINALSVLDT